MGVDVETPASSRLEELGYAQQLKRRLHVGHVVGLAMADVSPTMAVVFLTGGVFVIGGTFAVGANLLLAVAVMLIALCLAELASMYPIAGGMYSLVRHVLPAPITWITMFNYLIQGVVIPASVALGVASFMKDLIPGIGVSDQLFALIVLALATGIAVTKVEVGAWVTIVMVVVELVVLGIITVAALTHPEQNLGDVVFHPVTLDGATLSAITFGLILATMAPAFNVINGYDASLGFAEEMVGGERAVAKAVVISAALACVLIIVPLTAAVIAAPDLKAFLSSDAPVLYSVDAALGSGAKSIVDLGASVALFNAMLSLLMYFGRGVYTTGRDGIWPRPVSRVLGGLNRYQAPAAGVLALALPAAVLIFMSALDFLIIFAGTVIAAVYFCIGIAALVSRITQPDVRRPYRMPLWPLPPVVVIAFTGLALVKQEGKYLVAEAVLAAAALVLWALSRLWGGDAAAGGPLEPAPAVPVEGADARFGRLDVLVNNAGILRSVPTHETTPELWREVIATNLEGTWWCLRAALPGMLSRRGGRIVNVSSELGLIGFPTYAAYCASKGGVIALTKAVAKEVAPSGVLVNSVAPGPVETDMLVRDTIEFNDETREQIPLRRFGQPDEIARVIEFVAGAGGDFMVGQVLSPNGGTAI